MKSKHDLDCESRKGGRCDCMRGRLRRAKRRAVKWMKRHPFGAVEGRTGGRDFVARLFGNGGTGRWSVDTSTFGGFYKRHGKKG
jgi:hypothetical protein